jgi:hypothetical protein
VKKVEVEKVEVVEVVRSVVREGSRLEIGKREELKERR